MNWVAFFQQVQLVGRELTIVRDALIDLMTGGVLAAAAPFKAVKI